MRPDRQRRGARHGRGRKAGQAPERIPAPIQRAAARFLYLARPGAGFSPFPGFPRRVGKGHPSHRQNSNGRSRLVAGVPCPSISGGRARSSAALLASLVSDQLQRPPMPPHVKARSAFLSCLPPVVCPFRKGPPISPRGSALPFLPDQRRPACAPDPEGRALLWYDHNHNAAPSVLPPLLCLHVYMSTCLQIAA